MAEDFGKRIEKAVGEAFGEEPSRVVFEKKRTADERVPSAAGQRRQQLKIAVGSDHRGLALKRRLADYLGELGHLVVDCGITENAGGDYPDVALKVAEHVVRRTCDFGVLIDMIGVGSAIAANKIAGIRAAPCYDVNAAVSSRSHNDANVLCLGSSLVNRGLARRILRIWIETPFEGGRHQRRLDKITKLEKEGLDAGLQ